MGLPGPGKDLVLTLSPREPLKCVEQGTVVIAVYPLGCGVKVENKRKQRVQQSSDCSDQARGDSDSGGREKRTELRDAWRQN